MSGELDGLPTGATSENKETSGPPRPPAAADPPPASGEKRTGPPPAPITATVRVEEEENIQEMGGMLEADDQDGPDSELKGLKKKIVDEEVVNKENAVGEACLGSSPTYVVVLVVGGVVLILALVYLLLTLGYLAYRCHRRTKRSYQRSAAATATATSSSSCRPLSQPPPSSTTRSGYEQQLPATNTRF